MTISITSIDLAALTHPSGSVAIATSLHDLLASDGERATVPAGTVAAVIDRTTVLDDGGTAARIRILGGPAAGTAGWVPDHWLTAATAA
ncbi:MAG: hypothetical protein RLZZ127_1486 [Planctomycetota bacterium]|jgi:hypothetical protein